MHRSTLVAQVFIVKGRGMPAGLFKNFEHGHRSPSLRRRACLYLTLTPAML